MSEFELRIRIEAHQSAKGFWQVGGTVELNKQTIPISTNKKDMGETQEMYPGDFLLMCLDRTLDSFKGSGKKIAGE